MTATYTLRLDRESSGPDRLIGDPPVTVPSPAVVVAQRSGDQATYRLTVELIGDTWPVVTSITVSNTGRSITSSQLRDMRFGQLQRVCVSFLSSNASAGIWPTTETLTLLERGDYDDVEGFIERGQTRDWEEHWRSYIPPMRLDTTGESGWLTKPDPLWLSELKAGGLKNERTLRVTAAVYRRAVESGRPGNADVERFLELPRSTASEWIRRAREHGYLEQSPRKRRASKSDNA